LEPFIFDKIININSKNSMNSNNNKIKNLNKTSHFRNINNDKKNFIFKRNNTIEYENEYKSIFNQSKIYSRIKNSSINRKKIKQSNNNYNYNIKNTIEHNNNHTFRQKLLGKNNVINLSIPSNIGSESKFKLLYSFNQNKKPYYFLKNSITNYLGNISNSFNSDKIKDSFNSINNSLNKNKSKSKDGIMKNYLVSKNSFNNPHNNYNKIIFDYNGENNTLNTDEKISKKKYIYHTPLLVKKVLKKRK
jgi:hypothetical protein